MLLEVVSLMSPCANAVGTGSVPSNTTAKAAAGGFPPTSSGGAAGANSFNMSGDVRNVSPVQRNKRERNWCQKLYVIQHQRVPLRQREKHLEYLWRSLAIPRRQIWLNQITPSNSFECSFQSAQELSQQKLRTLDKLHEGPEDNITVICKVLKLSVTKFLGQAKHHVLNATIADATGQIVLDVWNDIISQLQENNVYTFTHLSVRHWNKIRKLTTTVNSVISQTLDLVLENVKLQENGSPQRVTTLKGPNIESIEWVEKFKICRHCSKRIIQVTQKIVNSDYCHHKLRASACATKLSISSVVNHEDNKLYLTIRDDPLQKFPTSIPYNADVVDSNDIVEKLLFLDSIAIMYWNTNKISYITVRAIGGPIIFILLLLFLRWYKVTMEMALDAMQIKQNHK